MASKLIRSVLFLILAFTSQASLAELFESTVDRTQIAEGESIILTLRYNSNVFSGNPDFTPLKQQFDIINTGRKNNFQYINGKSESSTIWTVALIPKRKGNLVLPSLMFKGESTKPIQISVNKVSEAIKNQEKDVFFHTEVDVKTAYVQGQVLYTEKLYFSVQLENSQLGEIKVDEAMVESLGEIKHYQTQLNGRSFGVYERQSLIFPQTSGEMVIPGPIFSGEISNGRWRGGRPIRISHGPITVPVLPKPASYPDGTWLPAKNIQLDYQWQGNVDNMKVGEPITLELSLTAKGLTSAQLPNLALHDVHGLKYYPDQAQTSDSANNSGVIGKRTQSIAVVPTKAGKLTLPEIRIPWWNTQHGKLEYAVLPAQRLNAFSSGQNKQSQTPAQPIEDSSTSVPTDEASLQVSDKTESGNGLWIVLSGVFALLWVTTLVLWLRGKSQFKPVTTQENFSVPVANLKSIKQACRNNQPESAREAIINWAQQEWDMPFASLSQVNEFISDETLKTALQELDYTLYSQTGNSAWQGEYLWQLFKAYKPNRSQSASTIPPLYPSEANSNV
jgi:DNA polymerase IIIc chi subunit